MLREGACIRCGQNPRQRQTFHSARLALLKEGYDNILPSRGRGGLELAMNRWSSFKVLGRAPAMHDEVQEERQDKYGAKRNHNRCTCRGIELNAKVAS